jgi:hypothetical protein
VKLPGSGSFNFGGSLLWMITLHSSDKDMLSFMNLVYAGICSSLTKRNAHMKFSGHLHKLFELAFIFLLWLLSQVRIG